MIFSAPAFASFLMYSPSLDNIFNLSFTPFKSLEKFLSKFTASSRDSVCFIPPCDTLLTADAISSLDNAI
ncbi:hypothetical protein D3C73_1160530 [compost metagenome]